MAKRSGTGRKVKVQPETKQQVQDRLRGMVPAAALTGERKNQHGDWISQATCADDLIAVAQKQIGWPKMPPYKRQAILMSLVKISRALNGDAFHEDHWDDLAGYAYLGKTGHGQ